MPVEVISPWSAGVYAEPSKVIPAHQTIAVSVPTSKSKCAQRPAPRLNKSRNAPTGKSPETRSHGAPGSEARQRRTRARVRTPEGMHTRVLLHPPDLSGVVAPGGTLRDAHPGAHVSRDRVVWHAHLDVSERLPSTSVTSHALECAQHTAFCMGGAGGPWSTLASQAVGKAKQSPG